MFSTLELPRADELGRPLGEVVELVPPPIRRVVLGIAIVVFLIAGLAAWIANETGSGRAVPGVLGGAAGLIVLAGLVAPWWRRRHTYALRLFERGVAVTQGRKPRAFLFEELEELSLRDSRLYLSGRYQGQRRRLVLRDRSGRSVVDHRTRDGVDPFGPWLGPFLEVAVTAFERRLGGGLVIAGSGWALDASGLRAGNRSIEVAAIAGAVAADDRLTVWAAGEELPFLCVPEGSRNAALLHALLVHRLGGVQIEVPGRGRLIYEHRMKRFWPTVAAATGLLMVGGGLSLLRKPDADAAPFLLLVVGATMLLLAANAFFQRFAAYERLLERRTLLGSRSLPTTELDGLDFEQTITYVNGVYTGTTVRLVARSSAGRQLKASLSIRGGSEGLDALRDALAHHVADRLDARLRSGESVEWGTRNLSLTPEGVLYRPSGLFAKKGEELRVPWSQPMTYVMQDGYCRLSLEGRPKPFVTLSAGGRDFYPGMIVLGRRAGEAARAAIATG